MCPDTLLAPRASLPSPFPSPARLDPSPANLYASPGRSPLRPHPHKAPSGSFHTPPARLRIESPAAAPLSTARDGSSSSSSTASHAMGASEAPTPASPFAPGECQSPVPLLPQACSACLNDSFRPWSPLLPGLRWEDVMIHQGIEVGSALFLSMQL